MRIHIHIYIHMYTQYTQYTQSLPKISNQNTLRDAEEDRGGKRASWTQSNKTTGGL